MEQSPKVCTRYSCSSRDSLLSVKSWNRPVAASERTHSRVSPSTCDCWNMSALKSSGVKERRGVEDGLVNVRIKTESAGLEGRFHHAVASMKIASVQAERLDDAIAGRRVPGVAQEHAADVKK